MVRRWSLELGLVAGALAFAAGAPFLLGSTGCRGKTDVHETDEARSKPCIGCHDSAFRTAKNPIHVNSLPETCSDCHTTRSWVPAEMTAARHTWFPLQNKHAEPKCADCHARGFLVGETATDCKGCHQKAYDTAQNPAHVGYPSDCTICHNDRGWKPSTFLHPWALANLHAQIPCASCHTGAPPKFKGVATDCAGCHQKQYDAAENPVHRPVGATSGMTILGGRTCAECHTTGGGTAAGGWRPSTFVHPTTPFELTGAHRAVRCNDCHAAPLPAGTPPRGYASATMPSTCNDCHQGDYARSSYPGHPTFSKACTDCHTTSAWKPALKGSGTHPEATFPLQNPSAHKQILCLDCHSLSLGGVATGGANAECVTCHGLVGTTWNPAHALPALDVRHAAKAVTLDSSGQPANFCLSCHPGGKR